MTRPLFRRGLVLLACLFVSLVVTPAGPACAQNATTVTSPISPSAAASAGPGAVSVDELARLVGTLKDEAARNRLIAQLDALIAAQRGIEPAPQPPSPATVIQSLSGEIDDISSEILAAAEVVVDAPRLVRWIEQQASDRYARSFWLEVALKLCIIFGLAALCEWVARILLRHPRAQLAARRGETPTVHAFLLTLAAVVEVLPILVFAGVAYVVLPFTEPRFGTAHVASVLIRANLGARAVLAVARIVLLSPSALALYPLGEETRNYLYIWARRFTCWLVFGFAVAEAAWWLGVPGAIYALLLRGTVLVLTILAVVFVLQNRAVVAAWLRGTPRPSGGGEAASPGESRGWHILRHRLGDTWHVLAIIYIVGTFSVYVLHIKGGFIFVLRATVLSIVVLLSSGIIVHFVKRLSRRGFAISAELKARFPTLEARANRYLPVLTLVASTLVYVFGGLALLQAWGVDAFSWLNSDTGRRATGSLATIATVLVGALILWEFFSAAIERYLNALDGNGRPMARSSRMRTLLPLLRTSMSVLMVVMVALIVLSELGVNIAPLLAGAGVVGLAVGFGSQALVKDVITGLFILIEDTLAVGDVVDLGGRHSGVVEAISIRTIRLRDMAGAVHTLPFSEVTTIQNLTKDYSYFVADVGVSYREDTDQVVEVLREVAEDLRGDPRFGGMMLEPIEIIGLDRFEDSAVIIKLRIKTRPIMQWTVGREFNRRMKMAFDRNGIEMPYPHHTVYFGEDKKGQAPPVHLHVLPADVAVPAPASPGPEG